MVTMKRFNLFLIFVLLFMFLTPLGLGVMSANLDIATLNSTYVPYNGSVNNTDLGVFNLYGNNGYFDTLLEASYTRIDSSGVDYVSGASSDMNFNNYNADKGFRFFYNNGLSQEKIYDMDADTMTHDFTDWDITTTGNIQINGVDVCLDDGTNCPSDSDNQDLAEVLAQGSDGSGYNITADYFMGDGSQLTGLSTPDLSNYYNKTANIEAEEYNASFNYVYVDEFQEVGAPVYSFNVYSFYPPNYVDFNDGHVPDFLPTSYRGELRIIAGSCAGSVLTVTNIWEDGSWNDLDTLQFSGTLVGCSNPDNTSVMEFDVGTQTLLNHTSVQAYNGIFNFLYGNFYGNGDNIIFSNPFLRVTGTENLEHNSFTATEFINAENISAENEVWSPRVTAGDKPIIGVINAPFPYSPPPHAYLEFSNDVIGPLVYEVGQVPYSYRGQIIGLTGANAGNVYTVTSANDGGSWNDLDYIAVTPSLTVSAGDTFEFLNATYSYIDHTGIHTQEINLNNDLKISHDGTNNIFNSTGGLFVFTGANIVSPVLAGTYTGGSAYVCVYNNGTIYASESACP
jgi:hypothetical protein